MDNRCNVSFDIPKKANYSVVPISCGNEKCLPGHEWGPGVRSHYLIHYIISGKGVFYCGPNKFTVNPGQIFVIYPGTIVKYRADEKYPWHYAWINFHGEEAKEIFSLLGISPNNPVYTVKNGSELLDVLLNMPSEKNAELWTNLKFTSKLYDFMSLLAENSRADNNRENGYLTTATRYIKAHYFEDLTVDQVAAHVGISRKYLFALFKKTLDFSPKDYILNYRIKRAKDFLKDENIPVGNIAYSVGYKDPLTFSKMFKQKTGVSPSDYRKRST